jgi:hypothetical protein
MHTRPERAQSAAAAAPYGAAAEATRSATEQIGESAPAFQYDEGREQCSARPEMAQSAAAAAPYGAAAEATRSAIEHPAPLIERWRRSIGDLAGGRGVALCTEFAAEA